MSGINNEHKIYLKALTPVHIGGAQEKNLQNGLDYIQSSNGKTWKLDWGKIYEKFDADKIAEAIINKKVNKIVENYLEDVAVEIEQSYGDTGVIKSFIRDGRGIPFIPGSSIKGAMKSWVHSSLERRLHLGETPNLLGKFDNDVFRFISIVDGYLELEPILFPTKTFNLHRVGNGWSGGWKHSLQGNTNKDFSDSGFVTDYECMAPNDMSQFDIKLRRRLNNVNQNQLYGTNKLPEKSYNAIFEKNSLASLFSVINEQVKLHVERELEFFKTYKQADGAKEITDTYDSIIESFKSLTENQCILRLSAGSGFHGISGDFQFEDHAHTGVWTDADARKYKLPRRQSERYINHYMKFKSRKIAFSEDNMYPMGFAILSGSPFENPSNSND